MAIFIQHGLGSFKQMAGHLLKLIIHCAQENQDVHKHSKIRGGKKARNSILYLLQMKEFVTSLIVLRRVGSSLVEMVRQQSVQCVLK